jgi:hypothetical protein
MILDVEAKACPCALPSAYPPPLASFKGLKDTNDTDDDNKEITTPSCLRKPLHSISFNDKMQQLIVIEIISVPTL